MSVLCWKVLLVMVQKGEDLTDEKEDETDSLFCIT